MTDYLNKTTRFLDVGLNLREASDLVKEGFWTRLHNTKPTHEGTLETRPGGTLQGTYGSGPIHTILKVSDSTTLFGSGTSLYRNATTYSGTFSGNRLSLVPFYGAETSTIWTYVGDTTGLKKVNEDGRIYGVGIQAPALACAFVAFGTGLLDSSAAGAIAYDWKYTYYSSALRAESNGSPEATAISATNQMANITVTASSDPQVDEIRVYRRGGTNPYEWRFVASSSNISGVITDNNADSAVALNEPIPEDNYVPFVTQDAAGSSIYGATVPYIFGPFLGKYILAVGDTYRKHYVYYTNADNPDGAGIENALPVTDPSRPLVNGLIYSSNPFVFSKDDLYALDYGGPNASPVFQPRLTTCGKGLAGRFAFCTGPLIFFMSEDGVYQTDGQSPAVSITEEALRPLFQNLSVGEYTPVDMSRADEACLEFEDNEVHFLYYDTSGDPQHLIYSILYDRWRSMETPGVPTALHAKKSYTGLSLMIGNEDGTVLEGFFDPTVTDDNGTSITCQARTGYDPLDSPQTLKEFGNIIVDADPKSTTITVTPKYNTGTSMSTHSITGTGRAKHPFSLSDTYGYNFGVQLDWVGPAVVYQLELLYRPDEEIITHWEFPETTHGLSGWQHLRDFYVTLRSTGAVTPQLVIDGTTYLPKTVINGVEYSTIPSTSGEKRKLYLQCPPVRGKVFRYILDGGPFRIYGAECEIRVKSHNTQLGYQLLSPFAPVGQTNYGALANNG